MGLHPVLEVDVDRVGWSVQKEGSRRELIARVKYDKITFRKPGGGHDKSHVEFEVAGAEDHDAAPRSLRVSEYYNFLRAFANQCRESVPMSKIGWEINAKYFTGLIQLGLNQEIPDWYGTLRTQAASEPMRREPPADPPDSYAYRRDSRQQRFPAPTGTGNGELASRGEIEGSTDPHGNSGHGVTVHNHNHISMSQAQTAQMNASFGFYGQAVLGELDRAYDYAQSHDPEAAPVIDAARQAALAGDTRGLVSTLRRLGGKLPTLAQQVMLPVLTALIENKLGLKS
jgi:hypothetical protein